MKNTKRMVFMAVLTSLSVVLGVIDAQIGVFLTFMPFAKIGLANIVIILSILYFDFKDSITMAVLKSLLVGLILGSISTFFIGFTGTMLSFFGMLTIYKMSQGNASLIFISVVGGLLHSLGQVVAVMIFYKSIAAVLFAPQLILVSVVTGVVIGMLTTSVRSYVDKTRVFEL